MHAKPQMTDSQMPHTDLRGPLSARHGHICSAGQPFARLTIGERAYEIADTTDGSGMLGFRSAGQQEWSALDRQLEEGWVTITADILLLDPDVLFDFLQTHAVRCADTSEDSSQLDFDTLGVKWSARLLQDRDGEVRFDGGDWHYARLGLRAPNDGRKRAIMLLLAAMPNARALFEPHVTNWASRIAKGVQIHPFL